MYSCDLKSCSSWLDILLNPWLRALQSGTGMCLVLDVGMRVAVRGAPCRPDYYRAGDFSISAFPFCWQEAEDMDALVRWRV